MGMTSEECLKASIAFELFLFCLKLYREYLKVVEIKFKYKLRLEMLYLMRPSTYISFVVYTQIIIY